MTGKRESIVAREDIEGGGRVGKELGDLAHDAAGLLDGDDVWNLGEAENGFRKAG